MATLSSYLVKEEEEEEEETEDEEDEEDEEEKKGEMNYATKRSKQRFQTHTEQCCMLVQTPEI